MPLSTWDFYLPSFSVIPLMGSVTEVHGTDVNYDKKAITFFSTLLILKAELSCRVDKDCCRDAHLQTLWLSSFRKHFQVNDSNILNGGGYFSSSSFLNLLLVTDSRQRSPVTVKDSKTDQLRRSRRGLIFGLVKVDSEWFLLEPQLTILLIVNESTNYF